MKEVSINQHIVANPQICHGKPTFRGTRVMVWQVLELLKSKVTPKELYLAYPTLPKNAIENALQYAVEKTKGVSYVPFNKEKRSQSQVLA